MRQLKESAKVKANNGIGEKLILEECNKLIREASIEKPPVDMCLLASFRGISRIINGDIAIAGTLDPTGENNFEVTLKKSDSEKRKRFTLAHEIVHTFLPSYQENPYKIMDEYVGKYEKKDNTEYLCDYGASCLLMPDFMFKPEFDKLGFSVSSLLALSQTFQASLEATAIKMVMQKPNEFAMVVWELKNKPSEAWACESTTLPGFEDCKPHKKLRVKFGYGFEKLIYFPKDKSPEESSDLILKSFSDNRRCSGTEEISFGKDKTVNCFVDSFPKNNKEIITLLRLIPR